MTIILLKFSFRSTKPWSGSLKVPDVLATAVEAILSGVIVNISLPQLKLKYTELSWLGRPDRKSNFYNNAVHESLNCLVTTILLQFKIL